MFDRRLFIGSALLMFGGGLQGLLLCGEQVIVGDKVSHPVGAGGLPESPLLS